MQQSSRLARAEIGWLCVGALLEPGAEDERRAADDGEFAYLPDCRRCHGENPDYFKGCVERIYRLHGNCHGEVHELESYFIERERQQLLTQFRQAAHQF